MSPVLAAVYLSGCLSQVAPRDGTPQPSSFSHIDAFSPIAERTYEHMNERTSPPPVESRSHPLPAAASNVTVSSRVHNFVALRFRVECAAFPRSDVGESGRTRTDSDARCCNENANGRALSGLFSAAMRAEGIELLFWPQANRRLAAIISCTVVRDETCDCMHMWGRKPAAWISHLLDKHDQRICNRPSTECGRGLECRTTIRSTATDARSVISDRVASPRAPTAARRSTDADERRGFQKRSSE
jgi:hypothetical protein